MRSEAVTQNKLKSFGYVSNAEGDYKRTDPIRENNFCQTFQRCLVNKLTKTETFTYSISSQEFRAPFDTGIDDLMNKQQTLLKIQIASANMQPTAISEVCRQRISNEVHKKRR